MAKEGRAPAEDAEKEIKEYEDIRKEYQQKIADRMGKKEWMEYNEILFSAHSCAIEGNSFTVDDTRILREQGMAMIPVGRSLLECTEMADHFRAFDYMVPHSTTLRLVPQSSITIVLLAISGAWALIQPHAASGVTAI